MTHQIQGSDLQGSDASLLGKHAFSRYDRKRIVLVLNNRGRPTLFRGTARCEQDSLLGCVLRIRLDAGADAGETDLLISEKEWSGRITPDPYYGCHYCFIPIRRRRDASLKPQEN
jgi:hypothetical protein